MLVLADIKRDETYISASYLPEGAARKGFLKIKRDTGEIVKEIKSDGYGYVHAVLSLKRLANEADIPESITITWY